MTATAATRRLAETKPAKNRKKPLVLGLAALVVTAGVAGAVVTSSAYFTDEKTVATNTVSTNSITLGLFDGQTTASALATFSLTNLAPYVQGDLDALKPKMKVFTVKNVGTGDFTWTGDVQDLVYTKTDDTPLPATTGAGSPSPEDAAQKILVQFGTPTAYDGNGVPTAVTWEGARTLAASQTATNKEIAVTTLAASATSTKVVRFYLDPTVTNDYQNVKVKYTLKADAEQIH